MQKINNFLLQEKNVSVFVLIFTIVPFITLSFFNVPIGDDLWYANSFIENGFINTQVKWYNEWSGRYMATFAISTLNPASFGYLNLAFIHPLLLIIGTAWSLRLLVYNIIETFKLGVNKLLVFSLLLFFYFNYIPDFGETFYWMAGAYTYQLPVIFFMLYLNALINVFKTQRSKTILKNLVIAFFFLAIVIGSNEVIAIYSGFINTLIFAVIILKNKKLAIRFSPLFILTLFLIVFMIFAPGNFGREALFDKTDFHFFKAIIESFSRGGFVLFFWIPTITLLMLLIPDINRIKTIDFTNNNYFFKSNSKAIIISLSFLLIIAFLGFFPSIYTTKWIPQRAYTPIFFVFTLFASVLIFVAIIKNKVLNNLNKMLSDKAITPVLLILVIITLSHNSNVMNAYTDLTSGKAIVYNKQVMETYRILEKAPSQDTFYVKELTKRPLILPVRWPAKHNRLVNNEWQEYFKIERVEIE